MICSRALILAGGESSRMGSDKALVIDKRLSPLPLWEQKYRLVREMGLRAFISRRRSQVKLQLAEHEFIWDESDGSAGPLAGLRAASLMAPGDPWLVVGCDFLFVGAETLHVLLEHFDGKRSIAYENAQGFVEPWVAIWSAGDLAEMIACDSNALSSSRFLRERSAVLLPAPRGLQSFNTSAEFAAAIQMDRKSAPIELSNHRKLLPLSQ